MRPKLSRLVSVFGLSERLIQKVKLPNVPITVLMYNGPLACSFNVTIKGLKSNSDYFKFSCFKSVL